MAISRDSGALWSRSVPPRVQGTPTRDMRVRVTTQINQHQPLVHATSRFLKRVSVRHPVKNGAPFGADIYLHVVIAIERGGLGGAMSSGFRPKGMPLDITYAYIQASVDRSAGITDLEESAATHPEARKCNNYARHVCICPSTSSAIN